MESDLQFITIRIKTLDNSLFDLKVPKDFSVAELKTKIERVLKKKILNNKVIIII